MALLRADVLAVLAIDGLVLLLVASAAPAAVRAWLRWDYPAASARQLRLERRLRLASSTAAFALVFKPVALALALLSLDGLAPDVPGAMCAVGVLEAAPMGWTSLAVRLGVVLLLGLWWTVHRRDLASANWAHSRHKAGLLLVVLAGLAFDLLLGVLVFGGLSTDRIVSCCGSLFANDGPGLAAALAGVPVWLALTPFYGLLGLAALAAWRRWPTVLGLAGGLFLPTALVALVAVFSPYVYELPNHRCPFCLLQAGSGYVGFALYGLLLAGVSRAMGIGYTHRVLRAEVPGSPWWSVAALGAFAAIASAYPLVYRLSSGRWL